MLLRRLMGLVAVACLGASTFILAQPPRSATAAVSCGVERWAVKTLSDRGASKVDFHARRRSVRFLRRLDRPTVGSDDPRIRPVEFRTYRIKVSLKEAVKEDDRDIHVVVTEPRHPRVHMIVELPDVHCKGAARSIKKAAMRRARRRFVVACGKVTSSFEALNGRAVIRGVGFWDIPHGQTGAAPNYIELHPLIRFRMTRGPC
jgi:hypothetical protein